MRTPLLVIATIFCQLAATAQVDSLHAYRIQQFHHLALGENYGYQQLVALANDVGPRLAGSEGGAKGVTWSIATMKRLGLDTVFTQEVQVPHWERGAQERGVIWHGKERIAVPTTALGGSVGTPEKGLRGKVVEITDFKQLDLLGEKQLKGKIVFFNIPMNPNFINTGFAYGQAVRQRWAGAIEASKYGAKAVIIRSVTLRQDDNPHTGSMSYAGVKDSIPAAAISTNAANQLSKLLKDNSNIEFELWMACQHHGMVTSHTVIGELRGSVHPEQYLVVGGHLDSWDLGDGSQDDGAGIMHALEVAHLYTKLGVRPKRTLRVVFFQNEEFGLQGGRRYAELADSLNENHYFAIESDMGSGIPRGFSFDTNSERVAKIGKTVGPYFEPYSIYEFKSGGSGADLSPLNKDKILLAGLRPESQRYFDYHHSVLDHISSVHPREFALGAAALAGMVYLIDQLDLAD